MDAADVTEALVAAGGAVQAVPRTGPNLITLRPIWCPS